MNRWVLGGLTGLLMLGFAYWKGYVVGQKNLQERWDAEKVVLEREAQMWKDKTRETERNMQKEVNKIQREKQNAVKVANTKYNALIDSLRQRPETRSTEYELPSGAGSDVGCTGAQLARPDAEFLAGYAADAERLQAAYNSCRKAYEVIQNAAKENSIQTGR
jgi:hypothetical protein